MLSRSPKGISPLSSHGSAIVLALNLEDDEGSDDLSPISQLNEHPSVRRQCAAKYFSPFRALLMNLCTTQECRNHVEKP